MKKYPIHINIVGLFNTRTESHQKYLLKQKSTRRLRKSANYKSYKLVILLLYKLIDCYELSKITAEGSHISLENVRWLAGCYLS